MIHYAGTQKYFQQSSTAFHDGHLELAATMLREAIKQPHDIDFRPALPVIMENLALICVKQNRYARAERLMKRSIVMCQKRDLESVCRLTYKLAELYLMQGRFSLAIATVQDALQVGQSSENRNRQMEVTSLLRLADLWNGWGQTDMAVTTYHQVLRLRQMTFYTD
jgi:tetratricopeptide (TPR) repeat protein